MLLFSPFKFYLRPIDEESVVFGRNSWVILEQNHGFVLLEPYDLTKRPHRKAVEAAVSASSAMAIAESWGSPSAQTIWEAYSNNHHKAELEYSETGKIKGYKALVVESKQTVWISHYDVEELGKRQ